VLDREPLAIVDIGSNSIRLVVYAGAPRIPSVIFNEKVLAGLGTGLAETGRLSQQAQDRAIAALKRFRLLIRQMKVKRTRVVATAAARDAANGAEFLDQIRSLGFKPEVISGEMEGVLAGEGVLSGIPDAEGIVGDLGGGSLELAGVGGGKVGRSISLPLGVLRIGEPNAKTEERVRRKLRSALTETGLLGWGRDRPFYLVGGSWRALARLDIISSGYPLPITHQYRMARGRPAELRKLIKSLDKTDPKSIPTLTASRIPTLPAAKLVLTALAEELQPSELIVSSFGIREGLLYHDLPPGCAPRTRWSRRRARRGGGSAASANMATCSTNGSRRSSPIRRTAPAFASPPACSRTWRGRRIPTFGPNAASKWPCTATGSGSTPAAA
jgi:exopolyphosphatase/guanosine-5'-triphosphate,3'-diphosphate pyrophosphatase